MSRWREMMMDYGQVFGSDRSVGGASSNMFSITGDLKDKRNADLQLRRTLEVHFRPLFQRFVYGGEKIACHDLRRVLQDPEYRDRLPPDKVSELADVADFNRGKAITYNEFVNIVLNTLPLDDLASMGSLDRDSMRLSDNSSGVRSFLFAFCRNTTAQPMVEEKMARYKCLPPPFFMLLITVAQIVVYIVVNDKEGVVSEALEGVPPVNDIMYMPTKRREAWRFVTYCFLHQGYVDLICNVILQLLVGVPLEMMFGWWRVAIVYLSGVIVGSCGQSIADHYVGLVGAAGGSYALVAANVVSMLINRKDFNKNYSESQTTRFLCSISIRIFVILLVVLPQISLAVYRRWFMDDIVIKIGIAAHVGGILAGATLCDAFLSDYRRSPLTGGAAFLGLFSLLFLVGLTVVLNIAWRDDYPNEDYS